jgi:hypothetical protein
MPDQQIAELLQKAGISFIGTVEQLGAATMNDLPVDDRTAVVRVDQVLHSPDAFSRLAGVRITLQFAAGAAPVSVGQQAAFFANMLAIGDSLAVTEVGRLPTGDVEKYVASAVASGAPLPFTDIQTQIEIQRLQSHASGADAIVLGRVVGLAKARPSTGSEHEPDWWIATVSVHHVERGAVQPGDIAVLFANSIDVRWRDKPKPKAGQEGVWILHATDRDLRELAAFQLADKDDYQPTQRLELLTSGRVG